MSHSKFAFFIIVALIILLTSSCGLDTIITLKPPEFVGFSDAENYFIFRGTGDYDSYYFRGFELYYKIYLEGSTVDSNLLNLSELTTKGFKRVFSNSDRINNINKPLIPLDSGEITVDFDGLEEPILSEPVATTPVELRRGIADQRIGHVDEFKPFTVFEQGDLDISSDIWTAISGDNPVTLAIYALSYGKRDLIIDVYSISVYLGQIDIELPYED